MRSGTSHRPRPLGAKRMVVGHTVQKRGVNEASEGKVRRSDVGLSRFYVAAIEALESHGEAVTVLEEACS